MSVALENEQLYDDRRKHLLQIVSYGKNTRDWTNKTRNWNPLSEMTKKNIAIR